MAVLSHCDSGMQLCATGRMRIPQVESNPACARESATKYLTVRYILNPFKLVVVQCYKHGTVTTAVYHTFFWLAGLTLRGRTCSLISSNLSILHVSSEPKRTLNSNAPVY